MAWKISHSPSSSARAISTSPSRSKSGTVLISRRYIRTGSLVFTGSLAVGVAGSSSALSISSVTASSRLATYQSGRRITPTRSSRSRSWSSRISPSTPTMSAGIMS